LANTALVSLATRQQVLLERLKASDVKNLESFFREAADVIRKRLASGELTELSAARAEAQLVAIRNDLLTIYGNAGAQINGNLKDLADYSAGAESRALQTALVEGVELTIPTAAQVLAAANARPLTSGKSAVMLESFIKDWSTKSVTSVENAIRVGYFEGQTNQQILKQVIGTKANRYADGVVDATARDARAVVQTAIQHVAQVARSEVYASNSDIVAEYEWVSTLDSRTTPQCQGLDGRTFPIGKGPLPPIHINCRSSTTPVINNKYIRETLRQGQTRASVDGQVPANLSYYEWLKTQPESFQDQALGPMRGQLLRDGGLSAQRFQELQLGKNFEPLTLEQMRALEPVAFERAGL